MSTAVFLEELGKECGQVVLEPRTPFGGSHDVVGVCEYVFVPPFHVGPRYASFVLVLFQGQPEAGGRGGVCELSGFGVEAKLS